MEDGKPHVLVVDDDVVNLEVLARWLERRGYLVDRATTGPQALQRLRRERVDLVLLDHQMPHITGLDVLRLLRQRYSCSDVPVIMVTASNDPKTVREAVLLGANDYVTKPVDLDRMLTRIQVQLGLETD